MDWAGLRCRKMRYLKAVVGLVQESIARWGRDKAHLMAAALAYYMIFALAPLLVISINIAGVIFGDAAVQGQIFATLDTIVGPEAALFIQAMVENAALADAGRIATLVGVALLLYGASNVFFQLKMALNVIWRIVPEPENGILYFIKTRSVALFMVVTLGFLFLLAFALTIALTALNDYLAILFPGVDRLAAFYQFVVIFPLMIILLALLFKILPDAHVAWRDVWLGSAVTAFFLLIGVQILSLVVGRFFTGSIYGAAGSLVSILLFVYISAQILFFGAEFTYVYANQHGSQVRPFPHAVLYVKRSAKEEEPVYPMPVYVSPPDDTAVADTPARQLEKRAAVGLVSMAVVLLLAFLLGRKLG